MTRPECFDFAMDFLDGEEAAKVRAYVEGLERERDQLLAALKALLSCQTIEGLRGHTGLMDMCVTGEEVRAGLEAIAAVEQQPAPAEEGV